MSICVAVGVVDHVKTFISFSIQTSVMLDIDQKRGPKTCGTRRPLLWTGDIFGPLETRLSACYYVKFRQTVRDVL